LILSSGGETRLLSRILPQATTAIGKSFYVFTSSSAIAAFPTAFS
jgi:hypothetical protein